MTYKQIEASREVRLWIKEIVVPVVGFATTLMLFPETREPMLRAGRNVKESIKNKFKKN